MIHSTLNEFLGNQKALSFIIKPKITATTRFNKSHCIFNQYDLVSGYDITTVTSKSWLMSNFTEDNSGDIVCSGMIKSFDSLQKAFDFAESLGLEFF